MDWKGGLNRLTLSSHFLNKSEMSQPQQKSVRGGAEEEACICCTLNALVRSTAMVEQCGCRIMSDGCGDQVANDSLFAET